MFLSDSRDGSSREVDLSQRVGIYSCGYTPRERVHLGNVRPFFVADLCRRAIEAAGGRCVLVQDVSDIGERVDAAATARCSARSDHVSAMVRHYESDSRSIGVRPPDVAPVASEHLGEIIDMIERLERQGLTRRQSGHVLLSIPDRFLSSAFTALDPLGTVRSMMCSTGQQWDLRRDVRLWDGSPAPTTWTSPWGLGQPDENIVCAALAHAYLGTPATVHVGSADLYTHHDIEMTTGSLAYEAESASTWIHSGVVEVGGRRMAHSQGNVRSVAGSVAEHGRNAVRVLYLGTHYSDALDASEQALRHARRRSVRLSEAVVAAPLEDLTWNETAALKTAMVENLDAPRALDLLEQQLAQGMPRQAALEAMALLGLESPTDARRTIALSPSAP